MEIFKISTYLKRFDTIINVSFFFNAVIRQSVANLLPSDQCVSKIILDIIQESTKLVFRFNGPPGWWNGIYAFMLACFIGY